MGREEEKPPAPPDPGKKFKITITVTYSGTCQQAQNTETKCGYTDNPCKGTATFTFNSATGAITIGDIMNTVLQAKINADVNCGDVCCGCDGKPEVTSIVAEN
jgi:hypothetical protein